jgi:hypothetical protein
LQRDTGREDQPINKTGSTRFTRVWLAVYVVAAGALLGITAEVAGFLPSPWHLVVLLGTPWAVAAFFAGRLARSLWTGALAGLLLVAFSLAANVLYRAGAYGALSVRVTLDELPAWTRLSLLVGGGLGIAGTLTNRPGAWMRADGAP